MRQGKRETKNKTSCNKMSLREKEKVMYIFYIGRKEKIYMIISLIVICCDVIHRNQIKITFKGLGKPNK